MSCNCVGRPSHGRRYGKNKPRREVKLIELSPPPSAMPPLTPQQIEQLAATLLIPGLRGAEK